MAKIIRGYVRDNPGGAALSGKTVTLKDAVGGGSVSTGGQVNLATNPVTSDANGLFTFTMDLSPGPVFVEADLGGGNKRVRYGSEVMQAGGPFISDQPTHLKTFTDGVINGIGSALAVSHSGVDRTVTVAPGYHTIQGFLFGWDSGNKSVVGTAYGGAGTRYDYLVLRQYIAGTSVGKQQILIVEGTDATDPVVTSSEADLTKYIRGTNIYDMPIRRVKTASGASVTTGDDLRTYASVYLNDLGVSNAKLAAGIDAAKISAGSVSNTEFDFLNGVTAAIQTQIDAKQALDATLTALAGLNATEGVVVQTAADAFTKRTLTGTANQIAIANAQGIAGNPTFSILANLLDNFLIGYAADQASSDNVGTADKVVWSDALSDTVTLPAGTYTIIAMAGVHLTNSASDFSNARVLIDATAGSTQISKAGPASVDNKYFGLAAMKAGHTGNVTVKVQYKVDASGSGTVTADNPSIIVLAIRTA